MMKMTKTKFTILIIVLIVTAVQGARWFKSRPGVNQPLSDAKSKGDYRAPIKIVEYSDFQCPACATGSRYLKEFLEKYPDKIFVQYRPYPLSSHELSMPLAIAGECAARQGKFWPYQELLFSNAPLLGRTLRVQGKLEELATTVGLDLSLFQECLKDPNIELGIIADRDKADLQGVKATPTYFVNGKMVVGAGAFQKEMQNVLGEKN
jgi:protein-disulfide isomerase